jgi:hypothetical protein
MIFTYYYHTKELPLSYGAYTPFVVFSDTQDHDPDSPFPHKCKPKLHGHIVSIWAKGVSRGVHNIAFSVSPDLFRIFDL